MTIGLWPPPHNDEEPMMPDGYYELVEDDNESEDLTTGPSAEIEPRRRNSRDVSIAEFLNEPEPEYSWRVPELLEGGTGGADRVILTGPEGGGKSTFLRQIAVQAAAGIHPFTLEPIPPVQTILIDLENGRGHLRRQLRPLWLAAGPNANPAKLRVISLPGGIDLANPIHVDWLEGRFETHRPQLLCAGPIYKMGNGDPTDERVAKTIATALDQLREQHGCAMILEAHQPYASNGGRRPERPYGASLWSRWPEFGLHLTPTGELRHWRGDRDERAWPSALTRGGLWPWTVTPSSRDEDWAHIVEEVTQAGERLSERTLAGVLGLPQARIHRAIKAHDPEWKRLLADLKTTK